MLEKHLYNLNNRQFSTRGRYVRYGERLLFVNLTGGRLLYFTVLPLSLCFPQKQSSSHFFFFHFNFCRLMKFFKISVLFSGKIFSSQDYLIFQNIEKGRSRSSKQKKNDKNTKRKKERTIIIIIIIKTRKYIRNIFKWDSQVSSFGSVIAVKFS